MSTTATRPAGNFGGKLREARERKGMSLRQIANVTKISVGMLDALERNDRSRLPAAIFSRAFVRSFASEVGLDPDATISEFIAQSGDDSRTAGRRKVEDNDALESDRRTASTFLRLLALSVPVAAVIIYFTIAGRPSSSVTESSPTAVPVAAAPAAVNPALAAAPASSGLAGDKTSTSPPAAAVLPRGEASTADRLLVNLTVSRKCWISATVDGRKQVERELQAGDRRTFEVHRDLVLTTGDAGAVTMTINGADAKPLGAPGEVVTKRLDLANVRTFLSR